jgi:methionyl-tRNA formyltransferase
VKNSKKNPTEIVIITGNDLRHQYFLKQLNSKHNIAAVFIQESNFPTPNSEKQEESDAWSWFFERRNLFEKETITPKLKIKTQNEPETFYLKYNDLNSLKTLSLIQRYSPGFIAVFGAGIIKERILSSYPNSIYNLHVGIPEFYRGSSCNFWPIYNCDFKNLGATIHRVEKGIDTGKVAGESFITLESTDSEQTLMWKTLQVGTKLMEETIQKWKNNLLSLKKQERTGKLYKIKEFKPAAILKVKKMVESGELKSQLQLALNKRI